MSRLVVRFLLIMAAGVIALAGGLVAAGASPPAGTCFAVADADRTGVPASVRCGGDVPTGYERRALWLRLPLPAQAGRGGLALFVHTTRFERLRAVFAFADGTEDVQEVRRGAFARHWHLGGQIGFRSPPRAAALVAAWLRIDGLARYELLRVRLVPEARVDGELEVRGLLVGGALALLALAALYNLGLAAAVRRLFFLWHGLWAAAVLLWGLVWSQAPLALWPGLAGTAGSRLATLLACLAVLFAALSAMAALGRSLPRWMRLAVQGLAASVALLGVAADLPDAPLGPIGAVLGAAILGTLLGVVACLWVAWRRGHGEARELALAWAVPMAALALTELVDFDTALFGGGEQLVVLFASAFQTLALSLLATLRLNRLRIERDRAVEAGAALVALAERDPLTGLLNRRGFVDRCDIAFGASPTTPFGLLLIDVDQFKSVNDSFGHEAGDAVLVTIAATLRSFEATHACLAGRLGGEEFVLGISGVAAAALGRFAEEVRAAIAACEHGELCRQRRITASIGVAAGAGSGPFRLLYGRADRALYEAKRNGRDRVVMEPHGLPHPDGQLALPLPAA